jgi:hypothetical protein
MMDLDNITDPVQRWRAEMTMTMVIEEFEDFIKVIS